MWWRCKKFALHLIKKINWKTVATRRGTALWEACTARTWLQGVPGQHISVRTSFRKKQCTTAAETTPHCSPCWIHISAVGSAAYGDGLYLLLIFATSWRNTNIINSCDYVRKLGEFVSTCRPIRWHRPSGSASLQLVNYLYIYSEREKLVSALIWLAYVEIRSFLFTAANSLEDGADKRKEFRLLIQLMARLFPDHQAREVFERILMRPENEDLFEKAQSQQVLT